MQSTLLALTSLLLPIAATQSLDNILSNHGSFSMLRDLLHQHDLLDELSSQPNTTFFAITDKAIRGLADFGINLTTADPNIARAIFRYALLDQIYTSESITSEWDAHVVHSVLHPPLFNNVTAGQAVKLRRNSTGNEHTLVLETGLGILTPVVEADIPFDHGIIHAIDANMVLPHNISETARLGGMTEFLRLMERSHLVPQLEPLADMTLFIPRDDAIAELRPLLDLLSPEQLGAVVAQHVVPDHVLYRSRIDASESVEKFPTLAGGNLQIRRGSRGEIFVDGAEVVRSDVLLYGGVAHVIDRVLFPSAEDLSSCIASGPSSRFIAAFAPSPPARNVWAWITSPQCMLAAMLISVAISFTLKTLRSWRSREGQGHAYEQGDEQGLGHEQGQGQGQRHRHRQGQRQIEKMLFFGKFAKV